MKKKKKIYTLDGKNFSTLESFFEEVSRVLIPESDWGHNLDAFNDILRGGFGTPEEGFILVWQNAKISRERLGSEETLKMLHEQLANCHPSNIPYLTKRIREAENKRGKNVFDILLDIIKRHCPGGQEASSGVELILRD